MREAERKKTIVVPKPERVTHYQKSREAIGRNPVLGTVEVSREPDHEKSLRISPSF